MEHHFLDGGLPATAQAHQQDTWLHLPAQGVLAEYWGGGVWAGGAGWERAESAVPSVSSAPEEVFLPGSKTPARSGSAGRDGDRVESPPLASSPTFAQVSVRSQTHTHFNPWGG